MKKIYIDMGLCMRLRILRTMMRLRYRTDELGWRVRTDIEVIKWKGAWSEEAIHVKFCGQDVVRRSQGALCK